MKFKAFTARCALVATCALSLAGPAAAQFWQCAPFAREVSGIAIRGNANTWWGQAAGKYERGATPREGAVLAFQPTSRMRVGHVAMVSHVVNDREVLLTHANWSRRGGIERNVRAIDVSSAGDWSQVKVWYAPQGGLGTSTYPVNGFIYSGQGVRGTPAIDTDRGTDEVAMANMTIATAAKAPITGALVVGPAAN